MDKNEFKEYLKLANLNKKELAELMNLPYGSVNTWGNTREFPKWVKSWLINYIKLKQYENAASVREKLAAIGADNSNLNCPPQFSRRFWLRGAFSEK